MYVFQVRLIVLRNKVDRPPQQKHLGKCFFPVGGEGIHLFRLHHGRLPDQLYGKFPWSPVYLYFGCFPTVFCVCCLSLRSTRWPLTSQGPTEIPELLSLCTTSALRGSMSTCLPSGPWATSSRITTGASEK